jgi:hypothetical protein
MFVECLEPCRGKEAMDYGDIVQVDESGVESRLLRRNNHASGQMPLLTDDGDEIPGEIYSFA